MKRLRLGEDYIYKLAWNNGKHIDILIERVTVLEQNGSMAKVKEFSSGEVKWVKVENLKLIINRQNN